MNVKEKMAKIKAFAFDVDGVLSANTIPLFPDGEPMRMINIKDGYAIHQAVLKGFPIAIISGGKTNAIRVRFESLGIKDIYLGSRFKTNEFADFLEKYDLQPSDVLFMGDDIPDFEVMKMVGIAACPCDAAPEIKEISAYISNKKGGEGCGRDVIEQVLKAQDKWMCDKESFGW
ncbi:MAG: HAD hydrolase family protein [Paludibacteraceae bacterium]|nr:HAD hydrolase family protein [Paludibacteraceae bacterium]